MVPNSDRRLLHPKAIDAFFGLIDEMSSLYYAGSTQAHFKFFEGFRHPERQLNLLAKGTTKAAPWKSPHQYGLAIDLVPYVDGSPTWALAKLGPEDMIVLDATVRRRGLLRPITWDPFHIEHPLWYEVKKVLL